MGLPLLVKGELPLLHQLDLDRQLELGQLVWLKLLARELLKRSLRPA